MCLFSYKLYNVKTRLKTLSPYAISVILFCITCGKWLCNPSNDVYQMLVGKIMRSKFILFLEYPTLKELLIL